jgi:SAM-dependent methyltransferase
MGAFRMGMNLHCMLLLQEKGILSAKNCRILDIGPQNVYFAREQEIRQFLHNQGVAKISDDVSRKIKEIEYFSTPRPEERTTMFSDLTELTGIEYRGFDICPAPHTEIFDLNFDGCPEKYRGHFDVVLNFGTTEHVFNQWNSFEVIHDATKIGGVIYCVLPMSAYLDHGYYCYTPLFFKDMAAANDYEMIDLFICPAGANNIRQLDLDVRHEKELGRPQSGTIGAGDEKLPQFNIHAIMRKTYSSNFRTGMEVATAHSAVDQGIAARYASGNIKVSSKSDKLPTDIKLDSMIAIMNDLHKSHVRTADEYRTDRERLETELADAKSRIDQMHHSISWRVSAPLRAISRLRRKTIRPEPGGTNR